MNKRIEKLKVRIEEFVRAGGNIYAPKRELPYYDYMQSLIREIRKRTGNLEFGVVDIYKLCGINYDKDFYNFKEFVQDVKLLSSGMNADNIKNKKVKGVKNVYVRLKDYAQKYNTTPFDFLVLMTGHYFTDCYINVENYEDVVKYLLLKEYPNRNLAGIKREKPQLYEQLRQLQHYYKKPISMRALVEKLGFRWDEASDKILEIPNKEQVLAKLNGLFPDKIIKNLIKIDSKLYYDIIRIARSEGMQISNWLQKYGFSYPDSVNLPNLSQIKVDAKGRYKLLRSLKQRQLEKQNVNTSSEVDLYHASLKASLIVIDFLKSQGAVKVLELSDKLVAEDFEEFDF